MSIIEPLQSAESAQSADKKPLKKSVSSVKSVETLGKSASYGILLELEAQRANLEIITITPTDDRYTIREWLRRVTEPQVLIVLPAEVEKGWQDPLDYEVLFRTALARGLEVAWVADDPATHPLIRAGGFHLFDTEAEAQEYLTKHNALPALRPPRQPQKPKRPWWTDEPRRPKPSTLRRPPLWLLGLELILLLSVLVVVTMTAFLSGPSARIVLVPANTTYTRMVAISVDPALEAADLPNGVIPSHRVGDEFESYVEVGTTGRSFEFSGRATGSVLFTNLLGQDYRVPEGTIVRTSSGSYPVRYATLQEVTLPAFGQAEAAIEALEEGTRGNVTAYQINLVEGVVGFAVRVTNPYPIAGANSQAVPAVSDADRARAWDVAAQQVMAKAYNGLQDLLEPGELLPQQELLIQATPKQAYTHLVGEQSPTLGLSLRLLVTGQAVKMTDVQAVAYRQLATQLPPGYTLTDARFEYGEAAEEDVGQGIFTFYVTTYGTATANVSSAEVLELVQGRPVEGAAEVLAETLPLARPPEVTVSPKWFPYMPFMPIRIEVEVATEIPQMANSK